MKIYSVHDRPGSLAPDRDVVLVKEGFCWPAFFLTALWALWHRLWRAFVAMAFLGAGLRPGADWVMEQVGFDRFLEDCDLVVTGEGAWDSTSGLGKVVYEVSRRSAEAGKPLLLACGRLDGVSSEPGLVAVDGGGAWLDEKGLARVVATALREHGGRLQGPEGPV